MKTKIAALTLLLFATAAPAAFAQDKDDGGDRPARDTERMDRMGHDAPRGRPDWQQSRPSTPAPAPEAYQPRVERTERHERPAPPAAETPSTPAPQARGGGEGRGGWRRGGDGTPPAPAPTATPTPQQAAETAARRVFQGDRGRGDWNRDGERHDGDRRDRDRNGGDRDRHDRDHSNDGGSWSRGGDHDRNNDGRRDGDRRWDGRRDENRWNNRGHEDRPRWDRRHFPNSYQSHQRYRGHYWRPPAGFYVRLWSYGDMLPRGWYAQDYRIFDWWNYDLPAPPVGTDWVRVGYDAILVDTWNGEVLQVVRLVFW